MEIIQSETFRRWFLRLRDNQTRAYIGARLARLRSGMFGDCASVGEGVSELRIHFGPGYRVYFCRHQRQVVVLLCGGDKGSQTRDINTAKRLAHEWRVAHG